MLSGMASLAFVPQTDTGHAGTSTGHLYHRALRDGFVRRLRATLTRQSWRLLDLSTVEHAHPVRARHSMGLQTVEIGRIRGSEGRTDDFAAGFYPLDKGTSDRWRSVASARDRDLPLAPVDLIQVGDTYYVCDGHHRISVAAARGELYIDAAVTVWELEAPAA